MRQFFAILKDSFREAVDGFVIYAMLGMSAIVILIVASMSFTPAPADKAFERMTAGFNVVFPEKGRSRTMTGSGKTAYKASDVQPSGGGYKLRLTVTKTDTSDADKSDPFRDTVVGWAKPAGKSFEVKAKGAKVEVAAPTVGTEDEAKAVTDAQMEEFVKSQFHMLAGLDATVARATGAAEPTYVFDVTTAGGASIRGWPHTVKIFFGAVTIADPSDDAPLGMTLWIIEDQIINGMGGPLALLVSLIITAFFIPNMLRKGSIDLLVSKPIGRSQLLVYKYVGGLLFMFLVTAFCVGGVWLVLAARSGYWDPSFLLVIPVLTFTFAILYAVSTLAAVLTRSPIVAMLSSVGVAVFLYIVGKAKQWADVKRTDDRVGTTPDWVFMLIDGFNAVLPRYKDLDTLVSKLMASGTLTPAENRMMPTGVLAYPSPSATVLVTLAFIAVMLAVSCWRFKRRDY